jgi:hypothetical protein
MHYAEFAEDEVSHFVRLSVPCTIIPDQLTPSQSAALLAAIKEYEQSKWKVIGQKVGKPAKVSAMLTPDLPIVLDPPRVKVIPRSGSDRVMHRPVNSMPKSTSAPRADDTTVCHRYEIYLFCRNRREGMS